MKDYEHYKINNASCMIITSVVRILASIAMIVFAGTVTAGATGAFFFDWSVINLSALIENSSD